VSLEAGLRIEKQTGTSDIGASTIDTSTIVPRLSGSFDLAGQYMDAVRWSTRALDASAKLAAA